MYRVGTVKRASFSLDMDLVEPAGHELSTRRTPGTVHEVPLDLIVRARRTRLAKRAFEDLTPESLEAMRGRSDGVA